MPLPPEILDELAAKRRAESGAAERDRRRALVTCAVLCLAWSLLGCTLIMGAAHTGDRLLGHVLFWGGVGLGNGGILYTILDAYRRGEQRGDW